MRSRLAVMATTFSLVVIFLPIAFMSGRIGRFFQSFGITIAFAICVSLVISFTLTPMLCSKFLKLGKHAGKEGAAGPYQWLCEKPYMLCLRFAMRHRWVVVIATVAALALTVPLFNAVGKDFIPKDDQSEFEVAVKTPEGWSLDRVSRELAAVEARLRELPAVRNILVTIGDVSGRVGKGQGDVTFASIYVRLAPLDDRIQGTLTKWIRMGPRWLGRIVGIDPLDPKIAGMTQLQVMRQARVVLREFPDLRVSIQIPAMVASGAANNDVEFNLLGPDVNKLASYADLFIAKMRAVRGIVDVDTTVALRKPELRVHIDRERAMDLGISIATIGATLQVLVGGEIVSNFKDPADGEQYDVWLRARAEDRDDPTTVDRLTVPSRTAGQVRLANLASLEEARGPRRSIASLANERSRS